MPKFPVEWIDNGKLYRKPAVVFDDIKWWYSFFLPVLDRWEVPEGGLCRPLQYIDFFTGSNQVVLTKEVLGIALNYSGSQSNSSPRQAPVSSPRQALKVLSFQYPGGLREVGVVSPQVT